MEVFDAVFLSLGVVFVTALVTLDDHLSERHQLDGIAILYMLYYVVIVVALYFVDRDAVIAALLVVTITALHFVLGACVADMTAVKQRYAYNKGWGVLSAVTDGGLIAALGLACHAAAEGDRSFAIASLVIAAIANVGCILVHIYGKA